MTKERSYTCPACGMVSYHPEDIRNEYCGNCHKTRQEVEAGREKPRILRLRDIGKEGIHGDGAVLVTDDRAIIEGGTLDVADYSVMATTAHGEGSKALSLNELLEMTRQAAEAHSLLMDMVRGGMKKRHARYIRELRLQNHSWRSIAQLCYNRGWEWARWAPPNNQIVGMALCERAADLHGENYMEEPWN